MVCGKSLDRVRIGAMTATDSTNMPAENSVRQQGNSAAVRGESIAEFEASQRHYSLVCHRDLVQIEELESEWQALENASPEGFDYFSDFRLVLWLV